VAEIRRCTDADVTAIFDIVNAAAEAYRGLIPADRWREPYMARAELEAEIADGVAFWGWEEDGELVGIMGIQPLEDVDLIRHAYVAPGSQGRGIGGELIAHLQELTDRQVLVGTWAAAEWAVRFYERHGFALVTPGQKERLLRTHWTIPERQIETSVVLAKPPLGPYERFGSEDPGRRRPMLWPWLIVALSIVLSGILAVLISRWRIDRHRR
jgi:GNAT superfamily N-acetyltransferase